MLASGKESILDCIFRIWRVPQEPKGHFEEHGQFARHKIFKFLSVLTKDTGPNCWLTFDELFCRRHNVSRSFFHELPHTLDHSSTASLPCAKSSTSELLRIRVSLPGLPEITTDLLFTL